MKIVVLDGALSNPGDLTWDSLAALGDLTVYDDTPPELYIERMKDADAVIATSKNYMDGKVFEKLPGLKYIGLQSTGTNSINLQDAAAAGIAVTNVPEYSTHMVAQHTFALLLEMCDYVGYHAENVKAGNWGRGGSWGYLDKPLVELWEKTIGLIGFGSIGRAVGKIAVAMGMKVLTTGSRPTEEGRAIAEYVDMDTLLCQSDIVSLHCPLTDETRGMINAATIAKMKRGVLLVNTARGACIVDEALAAALHSGHVAAAGLDVTVPEPVKPDNPLLAAPNCFITPHIAWAARDTRARLMEIVAQNLRGYFEDKPQNIVNGVAQK